MPIVLGRNVCCDMNETISREWLVSNGLGGYAAGTVAGVLTRMQHGLLVSSSLEAETPQLLLAKIDEEVLFDERTYYLGTNEYRDGTLNPSGFVHLEKFSLEEGFPVFTYRIGGIDGILLEKRIWMPRGQNTTFVQYRVLRNTPEEDPYSWQRGLGHHSGNGHYHSYPEAGQRTLTLKLLPFAAYRPYDQPQYGNNDWHFQLHVHHNEQTREENADEFGFDRLKLPQGVAACTIRATQEAHPYHIFAVGTPESDATFIPTGVWYWHFLRRQDEAAGLPAQDDLYLPGVIRATLWPGEESTLTVIVTAEEVSSIPLNPNQVKLSYRRSIEQRRALIQPQRYFGEGGEVAHKLQVLPIETSSGMHGHTTIMSGEEYLKVLLQAGDHFLVSHRIPQGHRDSAIPIFFKEPEYVSLLLSGYYGMRCDTRETLIALPGLTLATGRYEEATEILRNVSHYFKQGLLPDRLPLPGQSLQEGDYGNADAALWYFYALDAYLRVTRNYELLDQVYHYLIESIQWYIQGTGNGIKVDEDGLLRAEQAGKALTWMNAYVDGKPVTPRSGKPVEVNALWYYALSLMHEWSQQHSASGTCSFPDYRELAAHCKESFTQRFWNDTGEYLYDVVDGPNGDDEALRPNQLLALSLRYPVLDTPDRNKVFEQVTKHLLTPFGIRTLAPKAPEYCGSLRGEGMRSGHALHQGSVWPWLTGPYIDALLNAYGSQSGIGNSADDKRLFQEYLWRRALQVLVPFQSALQEGMLATIGAAYDGDVPHHGGGDVASALSVGELLRVYSVLAHAAILHRMQALSA
ncbi:MAG TPA: amylo-alpha-1,6-glucosidase [Ktedonobacteraceae bacterium]|nr:amylo-alpha-1,6-glucosidase [Ktedonobacteraceae bacterium]